METKNGYFNLHTQNHQVTDQGTIPFWMALMRLYHE